MPWRLLTVLMIVVSLMNLSNYLRFKRRWNVTEDRFKFYLTMIPVGIVLCITVLQSVVPYTVLYGKATASPSKASASSVWGVAFMLFLVLLMVSFRPAFHNIGLPLWPRG